MFVSISLVACVALAASVANAVRDEREPSGCRRRHCPVPDLEVGSKPIPDHKIMGAEGPKWSDVRQGDFGTCYFFAVLAAIAHEHPQVIKRAFIKQALWPQGIYTMRLLINGGDNVVAVNGMIPTKIVQKQTMLWPILLEKAYGKLFGSYKAMEYGDPGDAFKAIAQAPVSRHRVDAEIWSTLVEAREKHWPMSVTSVSVSSAVKNETVDSVGVARGHAFAVLDVREEHPDKNFKGKGQVVRIYNPWGTKNRYKGNLSTKETKRHGDFWMTFKEFVAVFTSGSVCVAHMEPNYTVSAQAVKLLQKVGQTKVERTLAISVNLAKDYVDKSFSVQLEWPEDRFLPEKCDVPAPRVVMLVARRDDITKESVAKRQFVGQSSIRVDINGRAGEYLVYLHVQFPTSTWMRRVVVNTYAAEVVRFNVAANFRSEPLLLAEQMSGLCPWFAYHGLNFQRDATPLNGMPVYKSEGSEDILWYNTQNFKRDGRDYAKFTELERKWSRWMQSGSRMAAEQGDYLRERKHLNVKCADSITQPPSLIEEEFTFEEDFVDEHLAATTQMAQTTTMVECGFLVDRLGQLENVHPPNLEDTKFPENGDSIARPDFGGDCGDSAKEIASKCEKYNVWGRMDTMLE